MAQSVTSAQIAAVIKQLLKKHKFTYADLGQVLDIKESSVKKMMAQGDFSVQRLEKIASWLGFNFFEFMEKVHSKQYVERYVFSRDQDVALTRRPQGLFAMILMSVGLPLSAIQEKLSLSKNEFSDLLGFLEELRLIERIEKGAVKILARGPFDFPENSEFDRTYKSRFIDEALKLVKTSPENGEDFKIVGECYMSDSSLKQMREEIRQVHEKYMQISRLEQEVIDISEFKPLTILMFNSNKDTWGPILNKPDSSLLPR